MRLNRKRRSQRYMGSCVGAAPGTITIAIPGYPKKVMPEPDLPGEKSVSYETITYDGQPHFTVAFFDATLPNGPSNREYPVVLSFHDKHTLGVFIEHLDVILETWEPCP